jgi:hypothetical protein
VNGDWSISDDDEEAIPPRPELEKEWAKRVLEDWWEDFTRNNSNPQPEQRPTPGPVGPVGKDE